MKPRTSLSASGLFVTSAIVAACMASGALSAEPESCAKVRMAEPGWNDLAFTTGTAAVVLDALGYQTTTDLLGVEIIYKSLQTGDLDVFLGYWDPAMITYYTPYKDDGSVVTLRQNLEGAKYTFAVPRYVYEAGVKDFADLAKFSDKFEKTMYGIEPGSNQLMLDVIKDPKFGLDGWEVVESSEVGMLTQVQRKVDAKEFVVFQGWAPHPMNTHFDLEYLTGGDAYFGPDFGAATVSTQIRKGYDTECPNVAAFLKNLSFTVDYENQGMDKLMNEGMDPKDAGKAMLATNPALLDTWLAGVTTLDGKPGLEAVKAALGL
jgi:glycine betaine/proline transport system substrate-binding protein